MKRIYFIISICSLFAFTSCLDYDNPGDELSHNQKDQGGEVFHGVTDSINYLYQPTEEGFAYAKDQLSTCMQQMITGEYGMRGGKQGDKPGAHAYQYQFSLGTDNIAGYFTAPQNFHGRLRSTLYIYDDFNSGPNGHFLIVKNAMVPLLNHPQIDSIPEVKALALLLLDYSAQEVTDLYGAMPFFNYKANQQENPFTYDSGKDIYINIINNLDTINACLKHYQTRPQWYKDEMETILYSDPGINWIAKAGHETDMEVLRRFANSLKLRMAMHMANMIQPDANGVIWADSARIWAEEAVAEGVIEDLDQEVGLYPCDIGISHPLTTISKSWNDTRLGASFESILFSLDHPYKDYLWEKNDNNLYDMLTDTLALPANTRVVGLRAGIRMYDEQAYDLNHRCAYSRLNVDAINQAPLYLMKLSEVDFLRAEGICRGWNLGGGESAQFYYERGIKNGFVEDRNNPNPIYTAAMPAYLAKETPTPYTYVDPMNSRYNAESVTTIGVKWNDGDDFETKLEKIITQKYIAGFPYSFEAWTDMRRTGYPKIFPILHTQDGDKSLFEGELIRRLPFPGFTNNATLTDINNTGVTALGGEDVQATRVFWDQSK